MGKRQSTIIRIRVITGVILCIALLLIVRLYYVQLYQHSYYEDKAERQYVHTVRDLYNRGSIFFTTKTAELVSAATIQSGYVLAVDPNRVTDADAAFAAINPILPLDRDKFMERATDTGRTYVEINNRVDDETATKIKALELDGVQLYRSQWRYYPGTTMAARTVGFVGYSDDQSEGLVGRYGMERYYDEVLSREEKRMSVNFFAEIFSNIGAVMFDNEPARTGDIVSTLEPTVSRMLDQTLADVQEAYGSRLSGGIIMDPKTGAIYAMNVAPTFDPNSREGATIEDFQNPLVENVYEMGSIMKALTMAAGLDSGAVAPSTTYYDSGELELDTFTIRNYDGRGRGTVDMQQVLNQSLNTGVAFIVETMGKKQFSNYFKVLKLGSETGIDLPNEAYGIIGNLDSPRKVEYATASFGQGIATTPIATIRALATLGNGGLLVTPHVAEKIIYQDGTEKDIRYPEGDRVFSEETSTTISRMLTTVVDDALRGGKLALPHHTIAAKTGTAQIAAPQGGYYDDRYLHSFFGYFPSYDPKFIVLLYTVEPKGVQYASETLTDPFMEIATFLINYYNVPPDR